MNIDFLADYIVLVAFGVCICIGWILKQWSFIPNNIIVPILAIIGIIINMWSNNWTITPEILLGGMFSGIAASGVYEYAKRFIDKDTTEESEA
jgi:hypothetical protein